MQAQGRKRAATLPIKYWSHSSLMAFLRNPLAWHKRYVEEIYDTPSGPSSIVGRAAHKALEHYYGGLPKEAAIELGLEYLRGVADFEINFGRASSKLARKKKREQMEREYLQAAGFFLEKPPKYNVVAVEAKATVEVEGLSRMIDAGPPLPAMSYAATAVIPAGGDATTAFLVILVPSRVQSTTSLVVRSCQTMSLPPFPLQSAAATNRRLSE